MARLVGVVAGGSEKVAPKPGESRRAQGVFGGSSKCLHEK